MKTDHVLEICNVTKHYEKKCALLDFSFVFKPGIYGLLGPNGAGKSTTMNIITMITMKNVVADVDTITTMIMNIIITITMKNAAVDADMTTIITTIIMQMKYLQAGAKKHLRNIIRKNWIRSYRNYPKMTAMV